MKKLFTLIAALGLTMGAMAADYTDNLEVNVKTGNKVVTSNQEATINVTKNNDGTYNFSLKDFHFGELSLGDVSLNNIPATEQNGKVYLNADQNVRVKLFPTPLPIKLRAELRNNEAKMYASMDITVALIHQDVNVIFGSGYQIPNSGFEDFHTEILHNFDFETGAWTADIKKSASVPNAWHSFMSATGWGYAQDDEGNNKYGNWPSIVYLASGMIEPHTYISDEIRPGSTGKHSAKVVARDAFIAIANGTMTTGRMNTGSTTPTDYANHAWLDTDSTGVDEHGDPFYTEMSGLPDSLAVWVKYNQKTPNAEHPYATVSAAITDGTYYQEPDSKTYKNVLALARNNKIEATGKDWKRIVIPFTVQNKDVNGKAILVTISTNADAGQGSDKDSILVDDINLIYNDPTNVKIDWNDAAATRVGNSVISPDNINVTYDGAIGAKVVKSLKQDGDNVVATVTVFNGDLTKQIDQETHTYEGAVTGIKAIDLSDAKTTDAPTEIYSISGQRVSDMQPGQVYIVKKGDKVVKVLKK